MRARQRKTAIFAFAAGAAVLGAAVFLSFELGRYQAGYSKLDARREAQGLEELLAAREAVIEDLRREQAILETSREIDRETYAQVEANLDRLQARIQAQEEELAFYRGIVSPGDGIVGLRVQDLDVLPEDSEQHHLLRLILVQAIVHNRRVRGTVSLRFKGMLDEEPAEFDLEQLVKEGVRPEMAYDFRYFQSLEQPLVLPVGFEPQTVEVEIRPREPRGDSITRSFQWTAVRG